MKITKEYAARKFPRWGQAENLVFVLLVICCSFKVSNSHHPAIVKSHLPPIHWSFYYHSSAGRWAIFMKKKFTIFIVSSERLCILIFSSLASLDGEISSNIVEIGVNKHSLSAEGYLRELWWLAKSNGEFYKYCKVV